MSPAAQAALFRFVSVLLTVGVGVALLVFIPDATVKVAAVGLVSAGILALEEYLKHSGGP